MYDLVNRNDILYALIEKGQNSKRYKWGESWELNLTEIKEAVESVPSETYERLTPKEPIFKTGESLVHVNCGDQPHEWRNDKWAEWCCPTCGWFVGEQYVPRKHNQKKANYCSKCGQAIDWDAVEPEKFARYEKKQQQISEWKKITELMKKIVNGEERERWNKSA